MATRRMFSIRLINSAKFLRMPISSQALYFHLGLHADDDGIVEAYPVIKTVGCTEDDLRVLVAKGFARVLNDDLVTYITDWNEHNKIRADRKIDSIYKDLLLELVPDAHLLEKKPRADRLGTDTGQPQDNQGTAQDRLGKDRLGEDRLGKDSQEERGRFTPPTLSEVQDYVDEKGYHIDAESFINFYESKGWMVGKNKMKDWKAAVRTWEKRHQDNKPTERQSSSRRELFARLYEEHKDDL